MILKNGRFTHAVFSSSARNLVLALWLDEKTNRYHEIAIQTDPADRMYQQLLETFTVDEISTMTDQRSKENSQRFEEIVKHIALKNGLIYDEASANLQERLVLDDLFNLPAGDKGVELLFNLKIKAFDLPAVFESDDAELKRALREATTPLEVMSITQQIISQ